MMNDITVNPQGALSISRVCPDDEFVKVVVRLDYNGERATTTAFISMKEFSKALMGIAERPCEVMISRRVLSTLDCKKCMVCTREDVPDACLDKYPACLCE